MSEHDPSEETEAVAAEPEAPSAPVSEESVEAIAEVHDHVADIAAGGPEFAPADGAPGDAPDEAGEETTDAAPAGEPSTAGSGASDDPQTFQPDRPPDAAGLISSDEEYDRLPEPSGPQILGPDDLFDLRLRVTAELGRARLPVAQVIGLGSGAIVDLDRAPDDAVDLYVNGLHYATGRLVLVGEEWALRIDRLLGGPAADAVAHTNGGSLPETAGAVAGERVQETSRLPSDG